MLELKNITKVYGKKAALQDVSVAFAPGKIVGLFGENGAGKTTLLCHLRAQLLPPALAQGAPGVLPGAFPPVQR